MPASPHAAPAPWHSSARPTGSGRPTRSGRPSSSRTSSRISRERPGAAGLVRPAATGRPYGARRRHHPVRAPARRAPPLRGPAALRGGARGPGRPAHRACREPALAPGPGRLPRRWPRTGGRRSRRRGRPRGARGDGAGPVRGGRRRAPRRPLPARERPRCHPGAGLVADAVPGVGRPPGRGRAGRPGAAGGAPRPRGTVPRDAPERVRRPRVPRARPVRLGLHRGDPRPRPRARRLGAALGLRPRRAGAGAADPLAARRRGGRGGRPVIDLVLAIVIISYAVSGWRQGLAVGALSLSGFLAGALLAMEIVPPLADGLEEGLQRTFTVLVSVLLFAWLGQLAGALLGARLRQHLTVRPAQVADQILGMVAGVIAVVLVLWSVGGALRGSPAPQINRAVSSSRLLAGVDRYMPNELDTLAENFRRAVAGSNFPRVFEGVAPEQILPVPSPDPDAVSDAVLQRARRSIVKIVGDAEACGRGQEGSGSVVGPQRVVTNAHVVAGVDAPTVQVSGVGERLPARVVLFDPQKDVAVLAVPNLTAPALPLASRDLQHGDDAVVAGFPRNGPFSAGAAPGPNTLAAAGGGTSRQARGPPRGGALFTH